MDAEDNRFSMAQALVLMSYWYESPKNPKDIWHWACIALSAARAIEFGFNIEGDMDALAPGKHFKNPEQERQWRRILWSAYCRYTITALGMRQPIPQGNAELHIPVLTSADFCLSPLPRDLLAVIGDEYAFLGDAGYQEQMAVLCIKYTELCTHLAHILSCQYSTTSLITDPTAMSPTITLAASTSTVDIVSKYDEGLVSWLLNLPACVHYSAGSLSDGRDQVLFLLRAFLKMLYLTTTITLHRPFAQQQSFSQDVNLFRYSSHLKVEQATTEIMEIVYCLHNRGLTRFLPLTAVTSIFTTAMFNIQQTVSENAMTRIKSGSCLHTCTLVMKSLADVHIAADDGLSMLATTVQRTKFRWCHQYLCEIGSIIAG
ncbi:hypothetical protein BJY01DRAFT_255028 [Aspergillus pseudoustus]|uniref:Xylanolytic transcriptional activator regulatory domain-containing protein n=1 Tax=Aspergillus pseudoustus TaxID=1810923 RepID=A0ABR4INL1_9EURO